MGSPLKRLTVSRLQPQYNETALSLSRFYWGPPHSCHALNVLHKIVICQGQCVTHQVASSFAAIAFESVANFGPRWRDREQLSQSESAAGKGNKHSFGE
jgi:hypothetical protein